MQDGIPFARENSPADKNISGTNLVAKNDKAGGSELGCVFIAADTWLAGKPPFCGKKVAPNSPYCPRHAALCRARR